MDKSALPKPMPTAIAVGITLLIWFVIPVPDKVSPNAWHLLALFIGTIAAIIGKAMPIGALSIVAISLVAITGVTRPGKPEGAIADALSGFSNPLIVDLVAKATNSAIKITWGQWALAALLPGLCMLLLMPLVLYFLFPPEVKMTPNAKELAQSELTKLGPMKTPEFITLGVLTLMLVMWAGVPAWLFGPAFDLNATTTAWVGLSLLLVTGVLAWEDILKAKSAWDTLIWFAALVMMATFFCRWCGPWRAPHAAGLGAGLCVFADDVADPLRYRHSTHHFWFWLHHPERVVDGRCGDERGQPAAIGGGWRLVDHIGLHLSKKVGGLIQRCRNANSTPRLASMSACSLPGSPL